MKYDVVVIGAGPGGIFTAYELAKAEKGLSIAVLELGRPLDKRKCPIDGKTVKSCVKCPVCSIMSGFGGAGAFSDGNTLFEHVGKREAIELMRYVDGINLAHGGEGTKLYSTANSKLKKKCLENGLHLLDAQVRHLGTDINYVVLENIYAELRDKVDFRFNTAVTAVEKTEEGYAVLAGDERFECRDCVISVGRSGSKWMESVCRELQIPTHSNRVDIGVRVELPAEVFSELTDELYESKIIYRTEKFEDMVRTFCMNPHGVVVNENTNGIVTVNGHSYEDKAKHTENTNFALLVNKHFSRRRDGAALRRSRARPQKHAAAHRRELRHPDARGHARRSQPCDPQTYPRRHHRDDLRPRQDRSGHGQRRHAALRRRGQVLQHGGRDRRKPRDDPQRPLRHRRLLGRDALALPRLGQRRLCRKEDTCGEGRLSV